jgi:hypothetical protein
MAPKWAEAVRALVLVFTGINLLVTWIFGASVKAQGGAYATGVMVLMSSAGVAVLIDQWRKRCGSWRQRIHWGYFAATAIFLYTTAAIIIEKPDGIKIAGAFIASIIVFSMISRTRRSTELRFEKFDFVDEHSRFLWDALRHLEFPVLVPHRPGHHTITEKPDAQRIDRPRDCERGPGTVENRQAAGNPFRLVRRKPAGGQSRFCIVR